MSKARLVITAVMLEGRSKRRWHETTTSPDNGYNSWSDATRPRVRRHSSRAHGAHTNARAVGPELEDRNVRLRKTLSRRGLDAGADTIGAHLAADPSVTKVPAASMI